MPQDYHKYFRLSIRKRVFVGTVRETVFQEALRGSETYFSHLQTGHRAVGVGLRTTEKGTDFVKCNGMCAATRLPRCIPLHAIYVPLPGLHGLVPVSGVLLQALNWSGEHGEREGETPRAVPAGHPRSGWEAT